MLTALRAGNYRSVAAQYAGIAPGTLYKYLAQATNPDADQTYVQFAKAVEKAEADAEIADLALIRRAAQGGAWQAAAWIRERKNPDRWGKREATRVEVTGADGGPVAVAGEVAVGTEAIVSLAASLARREELAVAGDDVVDAEIMD